MKLDTILGTLFGSIAAIVLVAGFAIAGTMGYADAQRERDMYCDLVRAGLWPDYRGTYESECVR